LVRNDVFQKVSFTGSSASGLAVAQLCAQRFARVTLELGGKSSAILLDDVDFTEVKDQLWLAMLQNNGQVCGAQSRVLIPKSRAPELRAALCEMFEETVVGDPRSPETGVGPVVTAAAANRIRNTCTESASQGAVLVSGTREESDESATVPPRLYEVEDSVSDVWNEELFGPVACLRVYDTEEEAAGWANQSRYGLSGSVWSSNTDRALRVAQQLKTGTVAVNSKKILDFVAPFGGWGQSGIGRELGEDGFRSYLETRTILLP
jgi:acyl-CoA reductase-like NAD-dependent aldehyde dehydrogenase